ncbi:uncharacterized protein L203_101877 [Cryptococcus depauperatus CBS 7841]|uniref:AN1-type domain-containing protein n=1 Tax=Cryptococcus depauperatus CBS 7841 TaxID=1295531 RepID=A0AAJ8JQM7_9TREE
MTISSASSRSEMMFLGKECNHDACYLHDFLPFDCPACHLAFCQPHFLPSQHACTAPLPPSMVDRIAPQCPMCNEIVPYPKSMNPNEAVERHILSGTCIGFQGGEERKKAEAKRRRDAGEICWRKNCQKVIVAKMVCESCQHVFCPTHRYATAHACNTPSPSASSSRIIALQPPDASNATEKYGLSRLIPTSIHLPVINSKLSLPQKLAPPSSNTPTVSSTSLTNPDTPIQKLDARAAAAAAAMKRAGKDVKVPFVKTKVEKRTKAEFDSQIKALKARHEKGLLTKAEQVKYAELVGEMESNRRLGENGKDKECIIA